MEVSWVAVEEGTWTDRTPYVCWVEEDGLEGAVALCVHVNGYWWHCANMRQAECLTHVSAQPCVVRPPVGAASGLWWEDSQS